MTASQPLTVATEGDRANWNPLDHPLCFSRPNLIAYSTWLSHIPLAMLVVDLLRPATIVELGTYRGVSYCAFCQAVKSLGLETRCFAIDTWQGDIHSGLYGGEVLSDLRVYHDSLYGGFSTLLQCTFDDALVRFEDRSVDLLHIDGLHTYEAVRHDFEAWLPKLSDRGVVLFHDIAEHKDDFGVWRLWAQISEQYPYFDVPHGHGLGVLAIGKLAVPALSPLVRTEGEGRARLQQFFGGVGRQWELQQLLDTTSRRVSQQADALSWLQQELADYGRMRDMLPVRGLRALNRYGFWGAVRKACRKSARTGEGAV
ncbi:MAG: class I SAM-dependent methyltransferase [Anaerolineae bacterium]